MASSWLVVFVLFLLGGGGNSRTCFPGCHCEVESFGLFDSFSLTKVDCSGIGPDIAPVPIPLDTSYLDLSSNELKTIKESMLTGPGYTTLVSLDLSYNQITKVSTSTFSKLRYLETLDLSHNSLEAIQDGSFSNLPLGDVDLSNNKLHDFNLDLFTSKGHRKPINIDLSNNLVTTILRSLDKSIPNIQSLNLAGNRLMSVPNLQSIPLRYLNLDCNPISKIEGNAFFSLKELMHLSLSNLQDLAEVSSNGFKGLQNLQVLDLSSNPKLQFLQADAFLGLNSLQELNLSDTGIASLTKDVVNYLPAIKSIMLGKNIHCWKTIKTGQFHRQIGITKKGEVLNCYDTNRSIATGYVL
ncbi:tsukushi isoform X1 [Latimeria chalumnae]|uniref:tsukushi isoform X1 n=1 Tax=Latimeria chalumnae TaxID=7897 RepID=UPI00313CBC0B